MKLLQTILGLLLFCSIAYSNDKVISEPIDIPLTGWNKVLQLSNGNTILFHFEARKAIVTKMFNTEHKEISSHRYLGKHIAMPALERSEIHGIYQIGQEAVVFISQDINNRNTLVRLCFNIETGKINSEEIVIKSESFKKSLTFSLKKNNITGGYIVFCMIDLEANFKETLHLKSFDANHNLTKDNTIEFENDKYDYINHISTCIDDDGSIIVSFIAQKIINYPDVMENSIVLSFLPSDTSKPSYIITNLSSEYRPYYAQYTYNKHGRKINYFLLNALNGYIKNGLQKIPTVVYSSTFLRYNIEDFSDMKYQTFNHELAKTHMKSSDDSNATIRPVPINITTNKFGISTILSEDNIPNVLMEGKVSPYTYVGNIYVTQVNDQGKELWSTTIPKRQFLYNKLSTYSLHSRGTLKHLFRYNDPEQEWNNQFASFHSVSTDNHNRYIIYNDIADSLGSKTDSVFSFSKTNAICYRIGRRRELHKEYLFDNDKKDESYACLLESSDYNAESDTYATLLMHRKDEEYTLRLGWRKMDEIQ